MKGHADSEPGFVYERAPQKTQRDIDMDKNENIFLHNPPQHLRPSNITTYFPNQRAALPMHDQVIVGDIYVHICLQKHGYPMEQRL